MTSLDIHSFNNRLYMCFCFPKTIQNQTKDKPTEDCGCQARRQPHKKLEEGYFILILSKHILKPSKQNWNGPKGKHILIQILLCFILTKALIFMAG